MSKKNVLFLSGVISVGIIIANSIGNYRLCGGEQWNACVDWLADTETVLLPFLSLFLFSLITYRMKEEVFQTWFRFARIALPIALALILIAPSYSSNWMFPYDKGMAAIIFSVIFSLASIGIIITVRMRNK